jgi:type IV pilus assembly protein PilC
MTIPQLEKISLTKHLAVMVKSGITLSEALTNLTDSSRSINTKKILSTISLHINNGSTLTSALQKYPKVFDEFYCGIIGVGEATGRLDTSLGYLAEQLGQDYAIEKKVKGALMYPTLVLISTLGLGAFISLYILPKLVDFFTAFESKLPASTLFLLKTAVFMKAYGTYVFATLFVTFLLFIIFIQLKPIRPYWHRLILSIPLFGNLLREREISRFARNLGTLIKSGVPVFEALDITSRSQANLAYRSAIKELSLSLEKGKNIADILKSSQSSFLFPRLIADMVSVGEKTGTIDDSLLYVSQFYKDDIEETARNLANILEPAVLVVIGLMVAFMALAIISPIYQLTGAIG